MKKLVVILIALLLLCGCSSTHVSSISNGTDEIYVDPDGKAFTKEDLYQYEKKFEISDALVNGLISKIAEKEGIDIEAIRTEAEDYINEMEESGYGEFITYYYGSKEAYIADSVNFSAKQKLLNKYVENDFETYVNENNPFKASVVYFDNEENPTATLEEMSTNESTFAYACTLNGYSSEVTEDIYLKDNDLPEEVKNWISSNDAGTSPVIKVAIVTTNANGNSNTEERYYLVNLVSKDVNTFKDEFLNKVSANLNQEEIISKFIESHDIKIFDQDIYDAMHSKYEVIK